MQRSHKHRGWRSLCGPLLLGHRVGRDSISGSSTPRPGLPAAWATRNDPVHTLRMLHGHIRCAVLTSPSRPHIPTHNPGCSVGQHLPLCGLVGSAASAGPSVLCHVPHWNAATTIPNAGLKAAAAQRQSLGSVARMKYARCRTTSRALSGIRCGGRPAPSICVVFWFGTQGLRFKKDELTEKGMTWDKLTHSHRCPSDEAHGDPGPCQEDRLLPLVSAPMALTWSITEPGHR